MICPECTKPFEPKRSHQRFCSNACRTENHAGGQIRVQGAVTAIRRCKGDQVSVTVRFSAGEAHNALQLRLLDTATIVK